MLSTIILLGILETSLLELKATILPTAYAETKPAITLTLNQKLATTSLIARQNAVHETVDYYADKYNVSAQDMKDVLNCENREYNPKLQSYHKDPTSPNGREQSYGLAQWNIKHNPITYEQAIDPEWSIEQMAIAFSKGKQHLWSCYKKLYPNQVE